MDQEEFRETIFSAQRVKNAPQSLASPGKLMYREMLMKQEQDEQEANSEQDICDKVFWKDRVSCPGCEEGDKQFQQERNNQSFHVRLEASIRVMTP